MLNKLNATSDQMYTEAQNWRQCTVSSRDSYTAVEVALELIHGNLFADWATLDVDVLFDPRWQLSLLKQYENGVPMWTVSASVLLSPDEGATLSNSVASRSVSFTGAVYSTLILAALLYVDRAAPKAAFVCQWPPIFRW